MYDFRLLCFFVFGISNSLQKYNDYNFFFGQIKYKKFWNGLTLLFDTFIK